MGIFDSIGSALGSFASGVGSTISSVLTNPDVLKTGASLLNQYASAKIAQSVAPSPLATTGMPWPASFGTVDAYLAYLRSIGASAPAGVTPSVGGSLIYPGVKSPTTLPSAVGGLSNLVPTQLATNALKQTGLAGSPLGFSTSSVLSGTGSVLSQLLGGGMPALTGFAETVTSPGTTGGGVLSELGERLTGVISGQPTFFNYGAATARPVSTIEARNPVTGKMVYWKYAGRPILFSGDLATARRVRKIGARLNRARPRCRPR